MTAKKIIYFSSDSHLLAELGERLIATREVALSELIKNAYDADASRVHIWLSDDDSVLNILDDGHGMSEDEFTAGWMRIATSIKSAREFSRTLKRPLTGSKGVGRFAVRLLGHDLTLETSISDGANLRAVFPWTKFEDGAEVSSHPISYWTDVSDLWSAVPVGWPTGSGTLLRISNLRDEWGEDFLRSVSGDLLHLQTPNFAAASTKPTRNGFRVYFSPPDVVQDRDDPTHEILDRAAIKLTMRLRGQKLDLKYHFKSDRTPVTRTYALAGDNLVGRFDADIRFLPRRPLAFSGLERFDGRRAFAWVRNNAGVKVYDRGFQVPPYGTEGDDWLNLSRDAAARRRTWDTALGQALAPMPEVAPTEKLHPALHLPSSYQVVGYVSLWTHNLTRIPEDDRDHYLQPAMDRQGFVGNDGLDQLYDLVRGALEVLAYLDLEEELRRKAFEQKEATDDLEDRISAAISEISANPDVPAKVRQSIERQLRSVQAAAQRKDAAQEETQTAVETLGLLGVLAAFMTHEATSMFRDVKELRSALKTISLAGLPKTQKDGIEKAADSVARAYAALESHINYARTFAVNVRTSGGRFKARPAIREIVNQLDYFTTPRHIGVDWSSVPSALQGPPVPLSVYSGLVMNLYTNALKAVLAKKDTTKRQLRVEADEVDGEHVLRVSDTGIGVADSLKSRIFDPLFSTSDPEGPLGPGMGMGLYIVRRVVAGYHGKIRLVEPPAGYSTTFELRLPHG